MMMMMVVSSSSGSSDQPVCDVHRADVSPVRVILESCLKKRKNKFTVISRANPGNQITARCKESSCDEGKGDKAGCVEDFTESRLARSEGLVVKLTRLFSSPCTHDRMSPGRLYIPRTRTGPLHVPSLRSVSL